MENNLAPVTGQDVNNKGSLVSHTFFYVIVPKENT